MGRHKLFKEKAPEPILDRFDVETKRNAIIDHYKNGLSKLAVAMKYKVNPTLLLKWYGDRDRILNPKFTNKDELKRIEKHRLKNLKKFECRIPPIKPFLVQPRILPLEVILANIKERKIVDKKKLHQKKRFIPKIRKKHPNVMFDDEYYTYKTFFTSEEEIIEIWGRDNIVTRPNLFYNVQEFVQNELRPEVEKEETDIYESMSSSSADWDDEKRQAIYHRLLTEDLYLSDDSDDRPAECATQPLEEENINISEEMDQCSLLENSGENMTEMTLPSATEIDMLDTFEVERDSGDKILKDENLWNTLSTKMANEIVSGTEEHEIGLLKNISDEEAVDRNDEIPSPTEIVQEYIAPESKISVKDEELYQKDVESPKLHKTRGKPRNKKGKKTLESEDITDEVTEDVLPVVAPKKRLVGKARSKKILEELTDTDLTEPPILKREPRARNVREKKQFDLENITDQTTDDLLPEVAQKKKPTGRARAKIIPNEISDINKMETEIRKVAAAKRGRPKRVIEANKEIQNDQTDIPKIITSKKSNIVNSDVEEISKEPVRKGRGQKRIQYLEKPETPVKDITTKTSRVPPTKNVEDVGEISKLPIKRGRGKKVVKESDETETTEDKPQKKGKKDTNYDKKNPKNVIKKDKNKSDIKQRVSNIYENVFGEESHESPASNSERMDKSKLSRTHGSSCNLTNTGQSHQAGSVDKFDDSW